MPKMLLPDINVWLALAFDGHVHHVSAKRWFDALSTEVCSFCRISIARYCNSHCRRN